MRMVFTPMVNILGGIIRTAPIIKSPTANSIRILSTVRAQTAGNSE